MKVVIDYPPNYQDIIAVVQPHKETIYTYGDTIYVPGFKTTKLSFHLLAHEQVHMIQQTNPSPAIWWERYLKDVEFRLDQELRAYRKQLKAYRQKQKAYFPFLKIIAEDLSSPMYGSIISYNQAFNAILG